MINAEQDQIDIRRHSLSTGALSFARHEEITFSKS